MTRVHVEDDDDDEDPNMVSHGYHGPEGDQLIADGPHTFEPPPQMRNNNNSGGGGGGGVFKWIIVGFLILGVCAVVVSVHKAPMDSSSSPNSTNNDAGGGGSSTNTRDAANLLTPPPANLHNVCAPETIDTKLEDCEDACWPSDCCDFPVELDLSCMEGNQADCQLYHASCHILTDKDTAAAAPKKPDDATINAIPKAPFDLQRTCYSDNLKTVDGFAACKEACNPAECCFDGQSCFHDNPEICKQYAPCMVLSSSDATNDVITKEVIENAQNYLFRPFKDEHPVVASVPMLCFYDSTDNDNDNDNKSCGDGAHCNQYTLCNALESHTAVDATKDEIDTTCSKNDQGDANGHESMCELICETGACCFAEGGCADLAPDLDCTKFNSCAHLFGVDGVTIVKKPSDSTKYVITKPQITAACAAEGTEAKCKDICKTGACCFDGTPPDQCKVHCDLFTACPAAATSTSASAGGGPSKKPMEITSESQFTKSLVDRMCALEDATDTGGKPSPCQQMCAFGECCFNDSDCLDIIDCDKYTPCRVVYGKRVKTIDLKAIKAEIAGVCSKEQADDSSQELMVGPDGDSPCMSLCKKGECCFTNDAKTSCQSDTEYCDAFEGCRKAPSDPNEPEIMPSNNDGESASDATISEDDVDTACARKNRVVDKTTGTSLCQDYCKFGECCFKSGVNCPSGLDCDKYDPCKDLYTEKAAGGGAPPPTKKQSSSSGLGLEDKDVTKAEIDDACAASTTSQALCSKLCTIGDCCFDRTTPCAATCSKYASCPTGNEGGDSKVDSKTIVSNIKSACASSIGETCAQACSKADCCFDDDKDCPSDLTCSDVGICKVLFDQSDTTTTIAEEDKKKPSTTTTSPITTTTTTPKITGTPTALKKVVDEECITTPPAVTLDCQDYCKKADCCFNSIETCASTVNCPDYTACKVVYKKELGETR
eukprot:CAMPEP_0118686082 /NCGR_PEP_ID=MMETSP0800-20121206/7612_1 /TAXON_ID=210618 ORGANISM="Striatella unipunctata, Strain CCMP2910" /NCGR_SAMPLE_ID=MMETSP0800 /ASSEMBLY_ACC=CAM_ASM_000638 /LENGTH=940 /DNA_ID=CAMNT_0006583081 /DNA_START=125 /DNA_END=2948 /DNA_ORIENTATION=+